MRDPRQVYCQKMKKYSFLAYLPNPNKLLFLVTVVIMIANCIFTNQAQIVNCCLISEALTEIRQQASELGSSQPWDFGPERFQG